MKRGIALILGLGLVAAAMATTSQAGWRLHVHNKGGSTEERFLADIDSLTFAKVDMILVPAGTFTMGSPPDEPGRGSNETQHSVTLTSAFYVCDHEVTQTEWQSVMGWNPSYFSGADRPVEQVTWYDCISYCNKRSVAEGLDSVYVMTGRVFAGNRITGADPVTCDWQKNGYRLPTEAEWEYAGRAGSTTAFHNGPITETDCSPLDPNLDLAGWYCGNSDSQTHVVGQKDRNAWQLHDMHGNAFEWVWDWSTGDWPDYGPDPVTDPRPDVGDYRRMRGGSWIHDAYLARSAARHGGYPHFTNSNIGFRVVRLAE